MPDERPPYDGQKRQSLITCAAGVVIGLVILAAFTILVLVVFPEMLAALTYPLLAVALIVIVGGGIYYLVTNRKREAEHAVQDERRAVSDDWVAKELAETHHPSADATREDPKEPDA